MADDAIAAANAGGNTASSNDGVGFEAGFDCRLEDNVSTQAGSSGFETGNDASLTNNVARNNGGDGIQVLDGSLVQRNAARTKTVSVTKIRPDRIVAGRRLG